ncbi:MAG TPA: sialidase family protein [Polyangiaceae bacterium]
MPISYTGNPAVYHPTISYPADGDNADEASISPLEQLLDNTANLKAEIEDPTLGLGALNARFDSIAALNFSGNLRGQMSADLGGTHTLGVMDYCEPATASTLRQTPGSGLYSALVYDATSTIHAMYYSTDARDWQKSTVTLAGSDLLANLIAGDTFDCALVFNATNLGIAKHVVNTSFGKTATTLVGGGSIKANQQGAIFFQSVYCWFLNDGLNNGIIVTSTDGVSVSRQAFGTVGDLEHFRGPGVVTASPTMLVAIGNTPVNSISQNHNYFLTSTDGISFSERPFPCVNQGKESFGGVAWNSDGGYFVAASYDLVTAKVRIYKSNGSDGTTWSLLKELSPSTSLPGVFAANGCIPTSLASVGSTIVMMVSRNGSAVGATPIYSSDGGATWKVNAQATYLGQATPGGLVAKLRGYVGQLLLGFGALNTGVAQGNVLASLVTGSPGFTVT